MHVVAWPPSSHLPAAAVRSRRLQRAQTVVVRRRLEPDRRGTRRQTSKHEVARRSPRPTRPSWRRARLARTADARGLGEQRLHLAQRHPRKDTGAAREAAGWRQIVHFATSAESRPVTYVRKQVFVPPRLQPWNGGAALQRSGPLENRGTGVSGCLLYRPVQEGDRARMESKSDPLKKGALN